MATVLVWVVVLLLLLWPVTPRALARLVRRMVAYVRAVTKAKRHRVDLLRWIVRRPATLIAIGAYETAVLTANGVDPRVKYLASMKASSLTGCPF